MSDQATQILRCLDEVAVERQARQGDARLAARVHAVKQYQQARFAQTYADMLADTRYGGAARFFLDDLYGPSDFTQRDAQFARIVPALARLFPRDIVETVLALARLHAVSEQLDTAMGNALTDAPLTAQSYGAAWRAVGRSADRERQVDLMLAVGTALDRHTRNPLLRHSLRMMRGPAQAAGMGSLQRFLEAGFDAFREMRGAKAFLDLIAQRERALSAQLFAAQDVAAATGKPG